MTEETYSKEGPKCPYCGFQCTADEAFFYDEQRFTEYECTDCEKTFDVEVCVSVSWTCNARAALAGEKKDD